MISRRSFLGSLAALAASRVAPGPVAAAAPVVDRILLPLGGRGGPVLDVGRLEVYETIRYHFTVVPRRDDGDTILELR